MGIPVPGRRACCPLYCPFHGSHKHITMKVRANNLGHLPGGLPEDLVPPINPILPSLTCCTSHLRQSNQPADSNRMFTASKCSNSSMRKCFLSMAWGNCSRSNSNSNASKRWGSGTGEWGWESLLRITLLRIRVASERVVAIRNETGFRTTISATSRRKPT